MNCRKEWRTWGRKPRMLALSSLLYPLRKMSWVLSPASTTSPTKHFLTSVFPTGCTFLMAARRFQRLITFKFSFLTCHLPGRQWNNRQEPFGQWPGSGGLQAQHGRAHREGVRHCCEYLLQVCCWSSEIKSKCNSHWGWIQCFPFIGICTATVMERSGS